MTYDFIGDVHGHVENLSSLLDLLGYRKAGGEYRHPDPNRCAVFLGDLIDRGPAIRETVNLVRGMVEDRAALAIMGNHEYNAICFHTIKPSESHRWMRSRTDKNLYQHIETLCQFKGHRSEWDDHLDWFKELPLWIDFGGVRAVHASWHAPSMEVLAPQLDPGDRLTQELLVRGTIRGNPEFDALQDVLKGPEISLPDGVYFYDKDGNKRNNMRVRWWLKAEDRPFGEITFTHHDKIDTLLPDPDIARRFSGYHDNIPVFFGHYWLHADRPTVINPYIACLDYSVASSGFLASYTWSGESELRNDRFTFS